MVAIMAAGGEILASDQGEGYIGPGPDEVEIKSVGVRVPLGRILLIRRGSEYGAVKFTDAWTEKSGEDKYGRYESYYQGDKTGDFSKKNVQYREGKLIDPQGIAVGGGHYFSLRGIYNIKCGPIKLGWGYKTFIAFYRRSQKDKDYGIELAPTKWTDISEVNVFDPRLRWYRYDEDRQTIRIPIDQLWETEKTKEKPVKGAKGDTLLTELNNYGIKVTIQKSETLRGVSAPPSKT
jgi:hypothetical protein